MTPLHIAMYSGDLDAARMLVVDGYAYVGIANNIGWTPLHWAASSGHLDVARMLAIDGHANVDITDNYGRTPLHEAVYQGHLDVARMLVDDCHADVSIADKEGLTPLHMAARCGQSDVAHFLLDKGAKPDTGSEWKVAPIDLAANPCNYYGLTVAPDVNLLCRMIGGSGALIVLAKKMVFRSAERDGRKRRADAGVADAVIAKHRCLIVKHIPESA